MKELLIVQWSYLEKEGLRLYKKDQMADILPVYGPEQAWLITDLLRDLKCLEKIP